MHFNAEFISRKSYTKGPSNNNRTTGRQLWTSFEATLAILRKVVALTKQLKGKLVNVDNNTQIMGYASGHNAQNYLQYLCDGLYYEELCTEQKKANVHPPSTSPSTLETTLPEGITDETPIDAVEEMLEHAKAGVAVLDGSNVRGLK